MKNRRMECSDMSRLTHADLFSFPLGLCAAVTSLRGLELLEKRITFIVDARLGNVSSLVGEGRVAVIWGQGDILTGLGVVIRPRQCSVASLGSGMRQF